jgi:serine/threonine-protein kinase
MTSTAVADLVGRVLASRYRLLAPVGTGASGRVFLADDVRLRRRVAVKVLHSGLAGDAGFLRRFRAEAQMAAALHHPHVMAVYDWGEDGGVPFMVLELLKGGSLRGLLDTGERLSPSQASHVGRQVAAALRYAHARGLVHRDIKPANLLFDEHGIVRVADFGLARALAEASWTEPAGTVVGTARYAAPEQASGGAVDGRADLYSLGVVLVESVTGEVPVVGETAISTLAARATRAIEAPPELGPLVPVVAKAGRPVPDERFADAAGMGAALTEASRRLPPPAPLVLAGLGDAVEDPEPTRIGRANRLFDQDATAADNGVDEAAAKAGAPMALVVDTRRRRGSMIPAVVAVAVVLVLVGAAAALMSGGRGATVAVPSLVGSLEKDAAADATEVGLLMEVVERRTSDDPAGLVIEQHPAPGEFLSEDSEVEVVVSRGPPPVALPAVSGKPAAEAIALLEQAGFVVAVERRYDELLPKDFAIDTDPPGSAGKAPRESTVKLFVSDGPAPVPVPDVAGKTFDEAATILANAKLQAVATEGFSDTVPVGIVIGTDPAVGQPAARDSQVAVIVSKGPEIVTVPNVVGMTVEEASAKLAEFGLTPDVKDYGPGKRVRAQDPAGGAQVKKGSKVTLFL